MQSETLKSFFKEYKEYLIATDRTANTADQYCTYLRKACSLLKLGEGFIEALVAISDTNVQTALCEYLMARLSHEREIVKEKLSKKQLSDYRSAVSALSEFFAKDENESSMVVSFLPTVALPCESVYDQKELFNIFKSRLGTQERYYYGDNASFSARILNRIATKTKRKNIYKDLIMNTRFLYEADESKFFLLKEVVKLTINTDGFVKIEVDSKEYDVYTQVYKDSEFLGFELLRVNSIGLASLDHIRPMHDLYPGFIATHSELRKLSDNVLKHRRLHLDMRMDKFATYYYNDIYPKLLITDGVNIDESLLMDEVCEFIKKLELLIVHKSYNSSKNDNI